MKLLLHHKTCYQYREPVAFGPHCLLLRPRQDQALHISKFCLTISPTHHLHWKRDLHDNNVGLLQILEPARELQIETQCLLEVTETNPFDFSLADEALEFPFTYDHEILPHLLGLSQTCYPRDVERVRQWLDPIWHPGKSGQTFALLQEINKTLYETIKYRRRERKGVQSPAMTLELKTGACRDFAALFIEICRALGIAARFVSGYLYSPTIEGDMSMHGWAEVYLPGAGWIGFDPSWGIVTTASYIPVAVSGHPEHVPPIAGTFFGYARDYLRTVVSLQVARIDLEPTKTELTVQLDTPALSSSENPSIELAHAAKDFVSESEKTAETKPEPTAPGTGIPIDSTFKGTNGNTEKIIFIGPSP